jgi:hypothetical protein
MCPVAEAAADPRASNPLQLPVKYNEQKSKNHRHERERKNAS